MKLVPALDLQNLDQQSLLEVDRACVDHGFFTLVGHGLNDLIDQVDEQARRFFSAPRSLKTSVLRPEDSHLGYFDRELTKHRRDQKEVFDYHGMPLDDPSIEGLGNFNFWPDSHSDDLKAASLQEFQSTLVEYYEANSKLALKVLELLCGVMNGDAQKILPLFDTHHASLARLNHYPSYDPLPEAEWNDKNTLGDMALHQHTDPTSITLLYQDGSGGLQTESDQHGWIDVPPEPYSFVVNVGDLLQAFSNDRYKAANHRVLHVAPGVSRYSYPFFHFPRPGSTIESVVRDEAPVYRAFDVFELLGARMEDNYSYQESVDTQLSNFKIR